MNFVCIYYEHRRSTFKYFLTLLISNFFSQPGFSNITAKESRRKQFMWRVAEDHNWHFMKVILFIDIKFVKIWFIGDAANNLPNVLQW